MVCLSLRLHKKSRKNGLLQVKQTAFFELLNFEKNCKKIYNMLLCKGLHIYENYPL